MSVTKAAIPPGSAGVRRPAGARTPGKAALASWIGSALEYYDFFIYGTGAALVFGKIFFPGSHPATATLLALATFGVGYVARGVLHQLHSERTQAGLILATAVFLPVARLPDEQLLSWGWRIPFLLSAVVVAIGFIIRRSLEDAPAFLEEKQHRAVPRLPLAVLFRHYRVDVLRVVCAALVSTVSTIFGVYTLSYAVNTMKIDRPTMLWVAILTNVVALIAIPVWATLADRYGRRPVFIFGAIVPGLLMFVYLWAISEADITLIFAIGIVMSGITYGDV